MTAVPSQQPGLSVLVMTYNEEGNLPRCLGSVQGLGDEIYVLDSFSTDRTVEIAQSMGARVEQHVFDGFLNQRARMIERASHDRVLILDADEWLSPELRRSIEAVLTSPMRDGYWLNRLNRIGDRWIRHGSWYPDRKMRLVDRRKIQVRGEDPHDIIDVIPGASTGWLEGDLLHHADDDFSSRFRTLEKHSSRSAVALAKRGVKPSVFRMCIKPVGRFITSYLIRRGFLDGTFGWIIARSEAMYVWMREVKLYELTVNSE